MGGGREGRREGNLRVEVNESQRTSVIKEGRGRAAMRRVKEIERDRREKKQWKSAMCERGIGE